MRWNQGFAVSITGVLLATSAAAALCSCRHDEPLPRGSSSAPALRIGVILPFSGPLAAFGEEGKQGIELAVAVAKEKLGNRLRVTVIYEDSKGDPGDTVRGFRKLVEVDRVDAVIGEVVSSNTLSIAPVADELQIPLVVPASTDVGITRNRKFVVRVCFLDSQQGKAMARYAYDDLGVRRVAILFDKGSDYSAGLATAFQHAFENAGGMIVGQSVFRPEDPDLRAQLVRIRGWKPDAVFLPVNYPQAAQAMRQARTVGLSCLFLGGDAWSSPVLFEIGGQSVEGSFITGHFAPDGTSGLVGRFVSACKAKYGSKPSNMAALSYDAARMLIDAGVTREKDTPRALRDALFATKEFKGVTGTFSIGRDGNPVKDIMILKTQAGEFQYVKTMPPLEDS